jgi:hypothetical protein
MNCNKTFFKYTKSTAPLVIAGLGDMGRDDLEESTDVLGAGFSWSNAFARRVWIERTSSCSV